MPPCLAADVVIAEPAALEVDHPAPGLRVPPDVIAGRGPVIASHVAVEEIFPLESVLRLVSSSVKDCRQFSERVLWQKLPGAAGLLEHRPGGDHRGRDQEDREQHPEWQTMNRGELNFIWLSET